MKDTKEIFVKGIIFSLAPAICNFLGSTGALDWAQSKKYIGVSIDVEMIKMLFFLASILLTFGLLTFNLIVSELNESKFRKQSSDLIKYTKEIMITTLAQKLGREYCDINIRIFVPKKSLLWKLLHVLKKDKNLFFYIKNIEGLADAGVTDNLKFRVKPTEQRQGLVGECFSTRKMVYDDNLIESNETEYNLTEYQINKTNDLRFIIVCPTFSENGEIDAIVSFDSKNNIKITRENQDILTNLILNYTQQLHEKIPDLFKGKGGAL